MEHGSYIAAGPYMLVGVVVAASLLVAFIGFLLHCDLRAKKHAAGKKPTALDDYYESLGRPSTPEVGF